MASLSKWTAKGRDLLKKLTPWRIFVLIWFSHCLAWLGVQVWLFASPPPAMCKPTCDAADSLRSLWTEITWQIINAHLYIMGIGCWAGSICDLRLWCRWRLGGSFRTRQQALADLAYFNDCWFSLDGRDSVVVVNSPMDEEKQQQQQQQQVETNRSTIPRRRLLLSTPLWKMDAVMWCHMLLFLLYVGLALSMLALDRFNRPPWLALSLSASTCIVFGLMKVIVDSEKRRMRRLRRLEGIADGDSTDSERTRVESTDGRRKDAESMDSEWTEVESTDK